MSVEGSVLEPDPEQSLEAIVRAELGPTISAMIRRLAVELARQEAARIAASLNGRPSEIVLPAPQSPQETRRALGEGDHPPRPRQATRRRCTSCGLEKPVRGFEKGRAQCRQCRAAAARARYRERQARARAAAAQATNGAEPDEPG